MALTNNDICEYARTTISCAASRLIGSYGFTRQDREDIEQDLTCELLQQLKIFDPDRGERNAFIVSRVNYAVCEMIRIRSTLKRQATVLPLNDRVADALRENSSNSPYRISDQRCERDQKQRELAGDVAGIIAKLPSDLQEIAMALQHESHRAVVARLGITRNKMADYIIQIRAIFVRAGLTPN